MPKKFAILIILAVLLGIAAGAFLVFQSPGDNLSNTESEERDYFPFGRAGDAPAPEPGEVGTLGEAGATETANVFGAFTELWSAPVAGFSASGDSVRLVDRGKGHIYEIRNGSSTRLSNTTIPGIHEAVWMTPTSLLLRSLGDNEEIKTYYGEILASTTSLDGFYLQNDLEQVAVRGKSLAYLSYSAVGILDFSKKPYAKKNIATLPLGELILEWPRAETFALTTKSAHNNIGYLYFLNEKGTITKVLGNIQGLTTHASPDGSALLYANDSLTLSILETKNNVSKVLPVRTLPEKCVWSKKQASLIYCAAPEFLPSGDYPDSWYQGIVSFSDSLWKIDTKTGVATELSDNPPFDFDAIRPVLAPEEDYLYFINKKGLTLWSFKLPAAETASSTTR
ncbi:MAG: hypothetical protein Q7S15_00690 [bacterium]|nr:hypothetical protein [bacterium]